MTENKALQLGYESNGLKVLSPIIPWFAEKIFLEVAIRFPDKFLCSASDFNLHLGKSFSIPGNHLHINDAEGHKAGKVEFQLDNLSKDSKAKIFFKKKLISEIEIPFLSKEAFLASVEVHAPALHCNFDSQIVSCQSFFMAGCKGVSVSAMLSSKYGAAFLSNLDASISIDVGTGIPAKMVARISNTEGSKSFIPIVFPLGSLPKKIGNMKISFLLEGIKIGSMICQGITANSFSKMIVVSKQSFVVWKKNGELDFVDELPQLEPEVRFGPTFWVGTKVDGLAGFADIKIQGYLHGSHQPLCFWEGKVLATSTPAPIAPVNLGPESFKEISYFEVLSGKNSIAMIKLGSKPTVQFTAEGTIASAEVFASSANVSVQDVFKKLRQFSSSN